LIPDEDIIGHPAGRSVYGVPLQPLDCWDRGFEYRSAHRCPSRVFVVYCVGRGLCDELTARAQESYRVCVCVGTKQIPEQQLAPSGYSRRETEISITQYCSSNLSVYNTELSK